MNLEQLRAAIEALLKEARSILEGAENGSLTDEQSKRHADLMAQIDQKQRQIDRIVEQMQREEALQRSQNDPTRDAQRPVPGDQRAPAHLRSIGDDWAATQQRAVRSYIRGDEGAIRETDAEMRAQMRASNNTDLNITTPADGGYLVPTGHYQGIVARAQDMMLTDRLGCMLVPGLGTTVNVPTGGAVNEFVTTNEAAAQDRDGAAFGQSAMTLVKFTKKLELSDELIADEGSAMMTYLNRYVGDAYGLTHNSTLVTEVLANGTSVTLGAQAAASTADIPLLISSVKEGYAEGAKFIGKRATQFKYLGLTGNNFQFVSTPNGGSVQSLWNYPFYGTEYVASIGSGNKSIAFGNWSYMGYRTTGMTFLRDPYSKADNGQLVLRYYTRIVYKVLQAEALVYGKHPTA